MRASVEETARSNWRFASTLPDLGNNDLAKIRAATASRLDFFFEQLAASINLTIRARRPTSDRSVRLAAGTRH
jgi:hypothetical protein